MTSTGTLVVLSSVVAVVAAGVAPAVGDEGPVAEGLPKETEWTIPCVSEVSHVTKVEDWWVGSLGVAYEFRTQCYKNAPPVDWTRTCHFGHGV